MTERRRYHLSHEEKDALLNDQAALIDAQAARIKELEAALQKPKKTSSNSHTPPSSGHKSNKRREEGRSRARLVPACLGV